jgi:hypothetical protein
LFKSSESHFLQAFFLERLVARQQKLPQVLAVYVFLDLVVDDLFLRVQPQGGVVVIQDGRECHCQASKLEFAWLGIG